MPWAPKKYLRKCLCSEEVSYLAAGGSRTGGGRSHTREPSSSISQSSGQSSTSSLSGIFWADLDWPWSPALQRARDDSIWLAPGAELSLSLRGVRSHAWNWEQALLHQFVGHDMVVRPKPHRAGWWVSAPLCIFDIRPKIIVYTSVLFLFLVHFYKC